MDSTFLEKLLPAKGLYCVAQLLPGGKFKHYFYATLHEANTALLVLDRRGDAAYIAQATYNPETVLPAIEHNKGLRNGERMGERTQKNAFYLKNFFLDIDCGEKWPLKTQKEGCIELTKFIMETGLPAPAVVNSGNGLYAHWIIDRPVEADRWVMVARVLKQVTRAYSEKLSGDSSRTSDSASVLRAPGTTNRKREHRPVTVLRDMEPISLIEFATALGKAAKKKKLESKALVAPKPVADPNAEFYANQDSAQSDANKVADRCAQIRDFRDTGCDQEPSWYACLGVVLHCADGEAVCHEWSAKNTNYSPKETTQKIAQWRDAGMGPATCAKFGEISSSGCIGCPHSGKIKSPIILGRPEPKAIELVDDQCPAPDGYRRSDQGVFVNVDDMWLKIYDQDLYVARLAFDESLGYEVMTIRHRLPHEGELECTIRSSLVTETKQLISVLSDHHIKIVGKREKNFMTGYLESYQARLQRDRRMSMLLCQMGWKTARNGSPMFVLGRKIFHADGTVDIANMAKNVSKSVNGYRSAGDLEKWVAATEVLGQPGMEAHAFALLAGGFGAPLMKFTGFDGAMLSLVGESGSGKTLMQRFIQSVWGYHPDLMMAKKDTLNAIMTRLGVYGNLPLCVDEVTNMQGTELSDLAYQVTQGKDRVRLTKNAVERTDINTWNTLAVVSTNSSVIDRLSEAKADASAEMARVFEYTVAHQDCFQLEATKQVYRTITENYGLAGEVYAKWMVQHASDIQFKLDQVQRAIDLRAEIRGEERFISTVATVAMFGGAIAQQLGLIRFDLKPIFAWAVDTVSSMRNDKEDLAGDAISILGQFLDDHVGNRLLVKQGGRNMWLIVDPPRGQLVVRHEVDTGRIYFSRAAFKTWLSKRLGSYTQVKNELSACGILLSPGGRKTLGSGTYFGGARQIVWEINANHEALGRAMEDHFKAAQTLAKTTMEIG